MPRQLFLLSVLFMILLLIRGEGFMNVAFAEDEDIVVEQSSPAVIQKGLPKAGNVQLTVQDLVLHADFETYARDVKAAQDIKDAEQGSDVISDDVISMVLHPSDIFDLHNMTMTHASGLMSEQEITASAAYFYIARLQGYKNRLSLDDEENAPILNDLTEKGYDVALIAFDRFDALRDFYLEKRQERQLKKKKVVTDLYNNMDVIGFIKFDQEGRICDMEDQDKQKQCMQTHSELIRVLGNDDYKDHCEKAAVSHMGLNMTVDEAEYAAAYHMVVDHKKVKFMMDQESYNRDDLRAYMDSALKDFHNQGFSPEDKQKMKVAQGIRPMIMKLCAAALERHK